MENNLLEKFKFGEHLRDLFRQAVHSWHPLQKLQFFNEIGQICTAAQTYCEDLEQELVFRANSKYPKYEVYTNQPSESMNWVLLPGRKKTRFLLMKCIEAWFMNHQAVRKNKHDIPFLHVEVWR